MLIVAHVVLGPHGRPATVVVRERFHAAGPFWSRVSMEAVPGRNVCTAVVTEPELWFAPLALEASFYIVVIRKHL